MHEIKSIIVDDEANARNLLKHLIEKSGFNIKISGEAETKNQAVELIKQQKPDLVFLDIELKDGTGFDIVEEFKNPDFKIIFITGFNDFAIKAFRCSAIDYILKPIDPDILNEALEKAVQTIKKEDYNIQLLNLLNHFKKQSETIVLNTNEAMHIIDIKDIIRCEADVNYTKFFLSENRKITVSRPLKEFEELLSDYGFFRCHQSHLVNIKYITKFDKKSSVVFLTDKTRVPVSYRKKEKLLQLFFNK